MANKLKKKKILKKDVDKQKQKNEHPILPLFNTTYNLNMMDDADCLTATSIYPLNIVKTNSKFRNNPKNYLSLIEKDAFVLLDAPESIRNNKELALKALNKDMWTARAVSNDVFGLESYQNELISNKEIKKELRKIGETENEKKHLISVIERMLDRENYISEDDLRQQTTANTVASEKTKQQTETHKDIKNKNIKENTEIKAREKYKSLSVQKNEIEKMRNIRKQELVEKQIKEQAINEELDKSAIKKKDVEIEKIELDDAKSSNSSRKELSEKEIHRNSNYDSSLDDMQMLNSELLESDENIDKILNEWLS